MTFRSGTRSLGILGNPGNRISDVFSVWLESQVTEALRPRSGALIGRLSSFLRVNSWVTDVSSIEFPTLRCDVAASAHAQVRASVAIFGSSIGELGGVVGGFDEPT